MGNSDQQLLLLLPRAVGRPADYTIRLVKCLPGPMNLGFLAALQNRFQHLPPSLPLCTCLHKQSMVHACCAGHWEMETAVQALFSWSRSWSPGMSPASVLSLWGYRAVKMNSVVKINFKVVSKWVRQVCCYASYQERVNLYLWRSDSNLDKLEWHHNRVNSFKINCLGKKASIE